VFNFEGYYDLLLEWFQVVVEEGFATPFNAGVFAVISKLEDLEEAFARYCFVPSVLHDFRDIAPARGCEASTLKALVCFLSFVRQ
jgi:hypothetical protein